MNVFKYASCLIVFYFLIGITIIDAQQKQRTVIKGVILDAQTHEPVSFANVSFVGTQDGATSNLEGKFTLRSSKAVSQIQISYMGYKTEFINIKTGQTQYLEIKISAEAKIIQEITVRPSKRRYRNNKNPAVELIEHVISNKSNNNIRELDYLTYEKYEKVELAISNIDDKFKQRKIFKKFQFVFDNVDTTKIPGSKVLPFYLKETLSDYYYRKKPNAEKEYPKGTKAVSFGNYFDEEGLSEYMDFLYQDIDIYNNNIALLTQQFLSPLASSAPTFYKFYIADTSIIDNQKCIKVFFSPRNKTDLQFQGSVYIVADSGYAVKKIEMTTNSDINLNWVRSLQIKQEFAKTSNNKYILSLSEVNVDFGVTKKNKGLFGQRSVSYKKIKINEALPDSVFSYHPSDTQLAGPALATKDWENIRHQPLSASETGIYETIDSIKKVPAFNSAMNIMMLLLTGYRDIGYFEIGPVSTFYSYNPIEGARTRFGGRTTNKFSKKIMIETYLAYGFKDKQFKHYEGLTYSLTPRSVFEFPVKSLKVSYHKETKIPGEDLQFVQEDNVLLSIKRGVNDKLLYNKSFRLEHLNEFKNHFSYTLGYDYTVQTPAGSLYYNNIDYQQHTNTNLLYISEILVNLRYAPNESFFQGKQFRRTIINQYPIIELQYSLGNKLIKNSYNYHRLKLSINKRIYLSVLGHSDATLEAGKIFGKVPYPLLFMHRANQTFSYQLNSFNMMNFLEFVSDRYISLTIDHIFEGFFFNKIPLLKKLKLREVANFKALYGSVDGRNTNGTDENLFKFPLSSSGIPITYTLEKKPYMEASVGVANIFRFFRVDVVHRLTYLDHPNITKTGLRMRFKLNF